jgi:hypothetical protein
VVLQAGAANARRVGHVRVPRLIPPVSILESASVADHTAINHKREDHTRLGFAMQRCALRDLWQTAYRGHEHSTACRSSIAEGNDTKSSLWSIVYRPNEHNFVFLRGFLIS